MINFQEISFKNVLSSGNSPVKIDFLNSKTTIITGKNGQGKSSLLDSLTFALYGKAFRKIKLSQMINVRNKQDMFVSLSLKIGSNQYKIERGIKPKIFNIYENDILIDKQAAAKDQQEYLETHILKLNEKSFRQIVILGSAGYNPFMRLNALEKRTIVEQLLGIQVFSIMNTLNKDIVSEISQEFKNKEHTLKLKEQELTFENKLWIEANQNRTAQIKELSESRQIYEKQIDDTIDILTLKRDKIEILLIDLQNSDKEKHESKISKGKEIKIKLVYDGKRLKEKIKFFESNSVCPSCEQSISEDSTKLHINEYSNKISEISSKYKTTESILNSELSKLEIIKNKIELVRKEQNQIDIYQSRIRDFQKEVSRNDSIIDRLMKKVDVVSDETIKTIELEIDRLKTSFSGIKNELYQRSIISNMLKDDGIKSRIIDNYLPKLNSYINKFLKILGSTISLNLNNKFDEVIKTRGREELKYDSFSEGEKQRIDLAILFAFREISGLLNNSTNLLILDETMDSSLDNNGVDSFLDIIRAMENTSVIVISHKGGNIFEKFQRTIEVKKNINGFTEYMEIE